VSHAHQPKAQVTAVPRVDPDLCRACRRCLAREVCRSKALLRIDRDEPPFVDAGRCYGCRACVPACPHGAIRVNGSA
jgi:MinD superfamily P-loop ATPase